MNILELAILKQMVGGGGGSGTDNYNDLSNLPQINGETLAGNKTSENLGLQDALTFDSTPTEDSTNPVESGGVYTALAGKQDNLTFDGVYNASTNKAATESTVTNAINGLDVSAFSVDADETISSISETDGKISVNKQDIAIASNQVVAMTGYTKPSSAPATPAIQQGDTANAAIGKLEYKADVNQTNILYTLQNGVKNILKPNSLNSWSNMGFTAVRNSDGSITVSGTRTTSGSTWFEIGSCTASTGVYYMSGGTSAIQLTITDAQGDKYDTDSDYVQLVAPIDSKVYIHIPNSTTSISGSATIYPMICTKDAWDQEPNVYRPFARSNSDLTQLQTEDRNALVEVVDKGAKNRFDLTLARIKKSNENVQTPPTWNNNVATVNGVTFTVNSDMSITVQSDGTNTNLAVLFLNRIDDLGYIYATDWITGCPSGGSSTTYELRIYDTNGQAVKAEFGSGVALSNGYYTFAILIRANQTINATFKPMICTKAEWDISPQFVPYCASNADLTALEAQDREALAEVVDSGAKNLFIPDILTATPITIAESGLTITRQSDGTSVKINGTYTGSDYIYIFIGHFKPDKAGTYYMSVEGTKPFSLSTYYVYTNDSKLIVSNDDTVKYYNYTTAPDTTVVFRVAPNTTFNNDTLKVLLCTKAAYDVSPAFVPYRMSYQDLCDKKAPALETAVVTSGSLDDIAVSTYALYHSDVTGKPETGKYAFCRTDVYDSTSAIQHLTYASDPFGKSYVRVKSGGTWRSWLQTTNA